MPKEKRVVPGKFWFLTWNNYTETDLTIFIEKVKNIACRCVGQEEVGESGTAHIQMKIECKSKIRPIEHFGRKDIHWEKSRGWNGHEYCCKDASRKPGGHRWIWGASPPVEAPEMYGWQLDVVALVSAPPDPRKVHWFWSKEGAVGKTDCAKYLCIRHGAEYASGKAADMKCALALRKKTGKDMPSVIVMNIPRTQEHVSYSGIEEIKDGLFFSGKYESGMVIMHPPHFIIFANCEPEYEKLSMDRWVVTEIKK